MIKLSLRQCYMQDLDWTHVMHATDIASATNRFNENAFLYGQVLSCDVYPRPPLDYTSR